MDTATIYNTNYNILDESICDSNSCINENAFNTNVQILLLK